MPILQSIRVSALAFVRDVLTQPQARQRGLLRADYVDQLLAASAECRDSRRLWEATILEYWFQVNGL